ncbi:hypothetical protein [Vermiculatibacterium agrestimuris]|uniref:hypothetical protein n=1 Tax=Vermiculatibacterium agrestimuris TaxID=2941519 RepID=UPI0020420696|nr:hypothetical protein [Vermiculatibacterium agrestimuris]
MKGLVQFLEFNCDRFFVDKRLVFVKAELWREDEKIIGSKVTAQIVEDKTTYTKEGTTNFGEQFVVKVRGVDPSSFAKLKPLVTEVVISDVERATVYGEYRNNLSVIATVKVVQ